MGDRLGKILMIALLIVVGAYFAQPYIDRKLYSANTPRAIEPRGSLMEAERTSIELFERVSPSVVQVVARHSGGEELQPDAEGGGGGGGGGGGAATGTGFLWDPAGHIVTNDHVVQGSDAVAVRLSSGQVVRATITGTAPNYDLAVLQLESTHGLPAPIAVGSSADLKVGQWVFAIGNPFGLDQSLTTGIISALKRRLPTNNGREIGDVIQTDAAINPGNSGGPLLDSAGRVVGVNTAIISPSGTSAGIGFAIPIDTVNRVIPDLIAKGYVPTPGIGIITASEEATTRAGVEGVVIVRTVPGSAAERAGLRGVDPTTRRLGDIVVGVNGKPVRRLPDLTQEIERVGVGNKVTLAIKRDGRDMSVDLEVADIGHRG
ncbi:MAG: S1C family serine protease [Xanthobacteraceae bacterium]